MKKWKCSVCGYIHEGNEPPEKCPVCGADKSKFVELKSEDEEHKKEKIEAREPEIEISPGIKDKVLDLMVKRHIHPISVHVPNGVVPLSVIFVILSAIFNFIGLSQAAFYNLIFVLLAMPVVLFSGYNEWQRKYYGHVNPLFIAKIICAGVVTVTAAFIVIWHMIDPAVTGPASSHRALFLFLNLVMLGATGIAGHLGGKLVFKD